MPKQIGRTYTAGNKFSAKAPKMPKMTGMTGPMVNGPMATHKTPPMTKFQRFGGKNSQL